MAFNLNGVATDAGLKFRNPFGSRTNTLLKSYIDSQLLLIRLKKLEEQGSTRALNVEESNELAQCVVMYTDLKRPGGVHKVSEKENDQLKNDVKSLLQDLQQNHGVTHSRSTMILIWMSKRLGKKLQTNFHLVTHGNW